MRKILLLLLPLAALGFAPAPVFREKPSDPDAVLRRLQGGWRGVSCKKGGRSLFIGIPFRTQLDKDHWRSYYGKPPRQTSSLTIAIDTKSEPMRIDWRGEGVHIKGIFSLSGDKLRYVYSPPNMGYPQSLTAPAPEDYFFELDREK